MDCEYLARCPEYSTCPINVRTLPLTFLLSPGLTSWVWDLWSPVGPTVQKSPRLFLLCSAVIILQFAIRFEQEVHPYFHFTLGSPDYVASLPIHFYFASLFLTTWVWRTQHSLGCPGWSTPLVAHKVFRWPEWCSWLNSTVPALA